MKITCPKCGEIITIGLLGRKPLNIPVIIVCDAIQAYHSVTMAAYKLGCSRGYIYKHLKRANLTAKGVIHKDGQNI